MTPFWISTGLLTPLILALLCWPLLRQRATATPPAGPSTPPSTATSCADLERDLASGALSQADYAGAREEIERRVLEDVADDSAPTDTAPRRLPRTALALVRHACPWPPSRSTSSSATRRASTPPPANAGPSRRDREDGGHPRREARKDPGNPQGWAMLGRSYQAIGRFADAAQAFDKAGAAMESDPELMLELVELAAERNEGRIEGRARELLQRVLAVAAQPPGARPGRLRRLLPEPSTPTR